MRRPSAEQRAFYLSEIWRPYHEKIGDELRRIKQRFGYAVLFDAHSIRGSYPTGCSRAISPDFNIGTNEGKSAADDLTATLGGTSVQRRAIATW